MTYIQYLAENSKRLSEKWHKTFIDTYPAESGKFLFNRKNQFTNPMGHAYEKGISEIYEALFCGKIENLENAMEDIVKIRSIQDYSASKAVNFMFILKEIITEEFKSFSKSGAGWQELSDALKICETGTKAAFDMLLRQREVIYEIKANEVKNRTFRMIDRLNQKYDSMDENIHN